MDDLDMEGLPEAGGLHILSREELEAEVRRRGSELREVMDTMADVLVTLDAQGHIEMANAAVEDVLGYDPAALEGRPVAVLLATSGDGAVAGSFSATDLVERLVTEERITDLEVPFETADGREIPMQLSASVMREDGDVTGYVCVAKDITERRRRERELERSRERYRTLFENNQLIHWEMDLSAVKRYVDRLAERADGDLVAYLDEHPEELERINGRMEVLDVNRKTLDFYGADSKGELLENLDETITDDSFDGLKRVWQQVADGENHIRRECEVRTFEGEIRHELLEWHVLEGHTEDYSRVFATSLDITERKRREQKIRRKNELLDDFASVVSHDIATPLGTIENKARLVELTGDTSHVDGIFEATERIRKLTDDLLELARQGQRVQEVEPVELAAVTREAWGSIATEGATLTVASTGTVEASRDRLRQLLENLLRNAVEHGPGESVTVEVGTFPDGFYVADDGPGIPEADRDRVFEQGVTTSDDSTGLGLAIVQRIVDAHGWTVEVTESEDVGECGDSTDGEPTRSPGARFEIRTEP